MAFNFIFLLLPTRHYPKHCIYLLVMLSSVSVASVSAAIEHNGLIICVRWGVSPPKIINSTKL